MSIVLVANQKGGVGKTTIATNLAVALSKKGKTILVDADSQQSSSRWNNRRDDKLDMVFLKENIKPELIKISESFDYVIVDIAGSDNAEFRSTLLVADKLIIPTQPSQTDIEVLPFVLKLVTTAKQMNTKLETFVVLNKAPSNSKSTEVEAAHDLLNTIKSVKTLKTIIRDRKQFRDAMIDGLSVLEMNSSKAKDEFNDFLVEII